MATLSKASGNGRSPYGERLKQGVANSLIFEFQSTLPVRGVTRKASGTVAQKPIFQSTLPSLPAPPAERISIHAPRTGSDDLPGYGQRRAEISIHAPRTGSDSSPCTGHLRASISIHAPRTGSDLLRWHWTHGPYGFQSTLPVRGATSALLATVFGLDISIHAPRTGSDSSRSMHGTTLDKGIKM